MHLGFRALIRNIEQEDSDSCGLNIQVDIKENRICSCTCRKYVSATVKIYSEKLNWLLLNLILLENKLLHRY